MRMDIDIDVALTIRRLQLFMPGFYHVARRWNPASRHGWQAVQILRKGHWLGLARCRTFDRADLLFWNNGRYRSLARPAPVGVDYV